MKSLLIFNVPLRNGCTGAPRRLRSCSYTFTACLGRLQKGWPDFRILDEENTDKNFGNFFMVFENGLNGESEKIQMKT